MLATRCLDWREATRALSPAVILIVVASLALGTGLVATGATDYLAGLFLYVTAGFSAPAVLSGLILLLAPLCAVERATPLAKGIRAVLAGTEVGDGLGIGLNHPTGHLEQLVGVADLSAARGHDLSRRFAGGEHLLQDGGRHGAADLALGA